MAAFPRFGSDFVRKRTQEGYHHRRAGVPGWRGLGDRDARNDGLARSIGNLK